MVALVGIIGAVSAHVIKYINRRTEALDQGMKRDAAFDAASRIEAQVQAGDRLTSSGKLQEALKLANATTPDRLEVKAADIEAALPRVRASLPAASIAPLPIPVTVVSSVPPDSELAPERPTIPRPAPLPRDTSREKAPIR